MPVNSIDDIWAKISEECKKSVSEIAYDTFFKYLTAESFDSKEFVLSTGYEYIKNTISDLYLDIIKSSIKTVLGLDIEPRVYIKEDEESIIRAETSSEGLTFEDFFTFDNFIVGPSNNFAFSASMAVANNEKIVYNPLIIYGPSGVGKTHLMLAIKNYIRKKFPYKKVEYTRGADFTNQFIKALQNGQLGFNTLEDFRTKFGSPDVLLVDDIHFIAGKESTQEEFFNIFNTLYQSGKQIVVTLDRPLSEIKTLDDRIRSRLSAGLFADITPPDFETRVGIIRKKAELSNITLQENLVYYIAEQVKNNTRQLEGIVKKLEAYINLQHKTPNIAVVQSFIKDIVVNTVAEPIKIDRIISEVARTYNVSENDILSNRRTKNLVLARQVAMYISREMTDMSYKAIGECFGKDHTTVLYNVNQIEKFLRINPYEKELVDELIKNLNAENE